MKNEAPGSPPLAGGVSGAKLRRSPTRLRSNELHRGSPCLRCRGVAEGEDRSPLQSAGGGQGIQAKANKSLVEKNKKW